MHLLINMTFKFTNPAIQFVTNHFYKEIDTVVNFEKLCDDFLIFLDKLPKEFEVEAISLKAYQELLVSDYKKANIQLVKEANQDVQFIGILSSYKVYKLFKSVLDMFNRGDFYSSMHMIRGIVETVCCAHYFLNKIKPLVTKLNDSVNDWNQFILTHQEFEQITNTAKKGTRIEIMIEESNDPARAKSSMNFIYTLSKNEKYKEIPKFYEILCEYVHPNNFSNTIFGILTKFDKGDKEPIKVFSKERIGLISGEMNKYYRTIPEKYSPMIVTYYGMLVKISTLCIELFKETIDDYKNIEINQLDAKPPFFDSLELLSDEQKEEMLKQTYETTREIKKDRLKKK